MLEIASGHPAIDRYLAQSYERVRGMSSRFAAAICGHLIRRQSALGIEGELVDIPGVIDSAICRPLTLNPLPRWERGISRAPLLLFAV